MIDNGYYGILLHFDNGEELKVWFLGKLDQQGDIDFLNEAIGFQKAFQVGALEDPIYIQPSRLLYWKPIYQTDPPDNFFLGKEQNP